MNKIELTREEAMLVMRLLNLFLGKAHALNVRDNSDVVPQKEPYDQNKSKGYNNIQLH